MTRSALSLLFDNLPRAGPGSDATTRKAIAELPPIGASPHILDIGCGPGKQTLVLARTLQSPVTAVDIHQPYLDRLEQAAASEGLGKFIKTRNVSMDALDDAPGSFDLIWAEGSAYIMGLPRALTLWKRLLRPGGAIAFSELTWLSDDRPTEVSVFWERNYPEMRGIMGNVRRIECAGYEPLGTFPLPPEDWWAEYYTPLKSRITRLRHERRDDPELVALLNETQAEIKIYERFAHSYGYVFYLARQCE